VLHMMQSESFCEVDEELLGGIRSFSISSASRISFDSFKSELQVVMVVYCGIKLLVSILDAVF
jgi:hypothetical protein